MMYEEHFMKQTAAVRCLLFAHEAQKQQREPRQFLKPATRSFNNQRIFTTIAFF